MIPPTNLVVALTNVPFATNILHSAINHPPLHGNQLVELLSRTMIPHAYCQSSSCSLRSPTCSLQFAIRSLAMSRLTELAACCNNAPAVIPPATRPVQPMTNTLHSAHGKPVATCNHSPVHCILSPAHHNGQITALQ